MWIDRAIDPVLRGLAGKRPAVVLTGSRQAGKTSLLERAFPDHGYVSLDLPAAADQAEHASEDFLARHGTPLIVDEVQYAPRLFRYLKIAIDRRRDESGLFLLTGSQKFSLMQGVSESLAGRAAIVELHTLSLAELEAARGERAAGERFVEWMHAGGYPELHARGLDPARFYADYVATYLERDVRQAIQVRNLRDFDRFLRLCALRTGQLLSMSDLAADVGVSPNTVKSWLAVLEASNVILLLPPYFRNVGKRLVKTPKLYFLDTGLLCFLAGIRTPDDLRASGMLGAVFETQVLGQIVRWYANRAEVPNLYFYRDHGGTEVDFVIPVGKRLELIECKWQEDPSVPRAFAALGALVGEKNITKQTVVTPAREGRPLGPAGVRAESCVDLSFLS